MTTANKSIYSTSWIMLVSLAAVLASSWERSVTRETRIMLRRHVM